MNLRVHFHHVEHRALLPALRDYARRSLRFGRTPPEHVHRAATDRRPAVYSASLGCHPHL
ncbi:hypothetical protein [Nocardia mexicana]|uniref:Uncharacterized protein n=1 Tax=Nocardia mexicana TaxID=279262 RepID=A0A370H482_9NOCA|nr:hypothetical protein [Nocardia mexicana]RDI50042.1 hypothetical protein DFR68_106480 [Nocardia mexicana]